LNHFDEVREILMALLDIEAEAIALQSYLVRDLGVESIDFLELAVALNKRFKIAVHDDTVFLRNLRLHLAQAKAQGRAPLDHLIEQYPFLSAARLEAILSDLESGPVIQVQDLLGYVQWQMSASKAA
jgi:acyl carrier protein